MRRIQPFTIGTKLSIPTESKCPECVEAYLPAPAVDSCKVKDHRDDGTQAEPQNSPSPVELSQEDSCREDISDSPTASSRSIKKIAICTNAETQLDRPDAVAEKKNTTTDNINNSKNPRSSPSAENTQLKAEAWIKRKLRDLKCGYSIPVCTPQHPDETSQSQKRDLKDFENSLIQLTTSLEDDPQGIIRDQTSHVIFHLDKLEESQHMEELIYKPWLKLRALLKYYHKDLMLALDVSSFYQQADNIIWTINSRRSSNVMEAEKDPDLQEITSQIRMLNEAASRLSNLHPTLATRVTRKQAEVKQSWVQLQETLRKQRPEVPVQGLSNEECDILTVDHDGVGVMGKDIKEEQNRLRGFESTQHPNERVTAMSSCEERPPRSYASTTETSSTQEEAIPEEHENKDQMTGASPVSRRDEDKPFTWLEESTKSARKTLSWLRNNIGVDIGQDSKHGEDPAGEKIEELLEQVEVLWDLLKRPQGSTETDEAEPKQAKLTGEEMEEELVQVQPEPSQHHQATDLPSDVGEYDSGMLTKFLERLEETDSHGMWQVSHDAKDQQRCINATVDESPEVHMDLNQAGECKRQPSYHDPGTAELMNLLSILTLRINQHLSRCAELSMDIMDMETDIAVRCEPDFVGLEGLQEQQDDLEVDYHVIEGDVEELERLAARLQALPPPRSLDLGEEVQVTLQAWEEVGRSMAENRGRLIKFRHLRNFFENYLSMIAWSEKARSCMFSGDAAQHQSSDECSDMDVSIDLKMEEFRQLSATGQRLIDDGYRLASTIRERTEELQSMLRWIQDNWRAQKYQKDPTKRTLNPKESSLPSTPQKDTQATALDFLSLNTVETTVHLATGQPTAEGPSGHKEQRGSALPKLSSLPSKSTKSSLGNRICLILSFDEQAEGISQVQKPSESGEISEATHRVSTYLHVTDSGKVSEEDPAKDQWPSVSSSSSSSSSCSASSSSSTCSIPEISTIFIPTLSKMSATPPTPNDGTKRGRSHSLADLRRATSPSNAAARRTNTWPMGRSRTTRRPVNGELQVYVKSSALLKDAADALKPSTVFNNGVHRPTENADGQAKKRCCYLSLGSTLSFSLPKGLGQAASFHGYKAGSPLKAEEEEEEDLTNNALLEQHRPTALHTLGHVSSQPSRQKQFLLSPVEEVRHETLWQDPADFARQTKMDCQTSPSMAPTQPKFTPAINCINESPENVHTMKVEDLPGQIYTHLPCCTISLPNHTSTSVPQAHHKCLSIHTKVKDLNGHIYHPPKSTKFNTTDYQAASVRGLSINREESVAMSSFHKPTRVIVCADVTCDVCAGGHKSVNSSTLQDGVQSNRVEDFQPGHWEFEEEEEELKGIWNGHGAQNDGLDICPKNMTQFTQEMPSRGIGDTPKEPSLQHPHPKSTYSGTEGRSDIFTSNERLGSGASAENQATWRQTSGCSSAEFTGGGIAAWQTRPLAGDHSQATQASFYPSSGGCQRL
ncbi:uncharacterized protein LOC114785237 isoform X2 [Denticeps clupeoides]|uniref:uncharacterized protein LOC114785237 isoform X2 n=1 Tax=Denticeps clupeoides TaxID=299321 RepID=UPI0010A552C3|nr:uncharacterized protein LOC114785237 isoform X2 [Denticeps clupeoides]